MILRQSHIKTDIIVIVANELFHAPKSFNHQIYAGRTSNHTIYIKKIYFHQRKLLFYNQFYPNFNTFLPNKGGLVCLRFWLLNSCNLRRTDSTLIFKPSLFTSYVFIKQIQLIIKPSIDFVLLGRPVPFFVLFLHLCSIYLKILIKPTNYT